MPSTTRYRRGDIVLVSFPFTDLSSSKRRPALVISPDSFNEPGQNLVLVAITSQKPSDDAIAIEPSDCVDGALPKQSFVKLSELFTVHSTLVLNIVNTRPAGPRHDGAGDGRRSAPGHDGERAGEVGRAGRSTQTVLNWREPSSVWHLPQGHVGS